MTAIVLVVSFDKFIMQNMQLLTLLQLIYFLRFYKCLQDNFEKKVLDNSPKSIDRHFIIVVFCLLVSLKQQIQ